MPSYNTSCYPPPGYEGTTGTHALTTVRSNAPCPTTYMKSPHKNARKQLFPRLPLCLSPAYPPHVNDTTDTHASTTARSIAPRPTTDNGQHKSMEPWVPVCSASPARTPHTPKATSSCRYHGASEANPAKTRADQIPAPQHPEAAYIKEFLRAVITTHRRPATTHTPRTTNDPPPPPTAYIHGNAAD